MDIVQIFEKQSPRRRRMVMAADDYTIWSAC
jgi:hypothetical protein